MQTWTFIAGMAGQAVTGKTVLITSASQQLCAPLSTAPYKQDVQPLQDQQDKLQQLRPATFHYKDEPTGLLQYGLIEEKELLLPAGKTIISPYGGCGESAVGSLALFAGVVFISWSRRL